MSHKRRKSRTSRKDRALISVFIVIIVISLICVGSVFAMNLRWFTSTENNSTKVNSGALTPANIQGKSVTFLVTGIDYVAGSTRGKLTDTIMVVNFDMEGKKINVLQIPRDSYIGTDYPTGKINAIYGHRTNGGINGLINMINNMFQLPIDHYVTVNMDGFIKMIDAIGGVQVDVPIDINLEGVHLNKGLQTLNGRRAEILIRERHSYANQDLGRLATQRIFMRALIKKMSTLSFGQITSLTPTLISAATTDLSATEMLGYYQKFRGVSSSNINFHLLPVIGGISRNGSSVLSIEKYPTADMLNEYFRPYMDPVPAKELNIIELRTDYKYTPPSNSDSDQSSQ